MLFIQTQGNLTHLGFLLFLTNFNESSMNLLVFQFARQFSRNEPLTFDWLCRHIKWPLAAPKNIKELVHLEAVHDVFDLYLWLRYCLCT